MAYNYKIKEVNLKASKLSSAEYQKAKKLKDFKDSDWKWNKDEDLYIKLNEAEKGDITVGSGIKSTVTSVNPETGTVAWDIDYVPAYDTVFSDFTKLRKSIDQLSMKTKDSVVNNLTSNVKDLYNQYRTYLRKNQPDVYKKFGSMAEEDGGGSVSNAAGGYSSKYFLKKNVGEETKAPSPNSKNPGATLGAGPSASADGVKNNAYVKQFKYKLVKQ